MGLSENQIVTRTYVLPEDYADRVSEKTLRHLVSARDTGEWLEVVDNLVASLRESQAAVTAEEVAELRELLEAMGQPTSQLAELNLR